MSYIRVINEDEAEGPLFKVYDEIQQSRGRISNVLRIQSLDPQALKAHLGLYMSVVYGKGPLPRRERELVAVVVSATNGCHYCITHHKEALGKYAKDRAWVDQLANDYTKADLEERDRLLCDYAVGLTKEPGDNRKEGVETLRENGFSDEEILHTVEITAYFNFVNRLVHGLGVDLEDGDERDYHY